MRGRIAIVLVAAACTPRDEALAPSGSATIVARGDAVYSVVPWDGTVVRTDVGAKDSVELALGGEPTRIAPVGDELWVTLRAERQVAILREEGRDGLEEVERLAVGAEPYGIVTSPDGKRVYVAVSQEDRVLEIEAATRETLRAWEVRDDPRWLALHPSDRALFVAHAHQAGLTRIDLRSGEVDTLDAPRTEAPGPEQLPLDGRSTGDPIVSDHGDVVVVPTLYVDNQTPGAQPTFFGDEIQPPPVPYYAGEFGGSQSVQPAISRFNPALVAFPLAEDDGRVRADEPALAVFVGGFTSSGEVIRGYVSSAAFDEEGVRVWATLETADAVALVDLRPTVAQGDAPILLPELAPSPDQPGTNGFHERPQVFVRTGNGPSGIARDREGRTWIHERGERRVAWLEGSDVKDGLAHAAKGLSFTFPELHRTVGAVEAGRSRLEPDVEAGRRLFSSARDERITTEGAGVSCSTCHFEGREDGLTWAFDADPRQTPSLAGPVSRTLPVTWTDGIETVADEAMITTIGRMGGVGLQPHEAEQVAAWIDFVRDVDVPLRGADDPLVAQGAELFRREDVGCAECHAGERFTDNGMHEMFGKVVNTPTLVGISATAPYLHDGSAPTLRALLERVRDGSMGSTANLTDPELDALEAYLRSL